VRSYARYEYILRSAAVRSNCVNKARQRRPVSTIARSCSSACRERDTYVISLDETLDSLLDDQRVRPEARGQMLAHLGHQRRVLHGLAALHDAHDARLDLVLAVLVDLDARHGALFVGLLGREGLNLEAVQSALEGLVEQESVGIFDLLGLYRACGEY